MHGIGTKDQGKFLSYRGGEGWRGGGKGGEIEMRRSNSFSYFRDNYLYVKKLQNVKAFVVAGIQIWQNFGENVFVPTVVGMELISITNNNRGG